MTKIIEIEKCGDCPHCCAEPFTSHCWHESAAVKETDPDSPPPENCPLLDLDAVVDKAKAANPHMKAFVDAMVLNDFSREAAADILVKLEQNCPYDTKYLNGDARRYWKLGVSDALWEIRASKGGGE